MKPNCTHYKAFATSLLWNIAHLTRRTGSLSLTEHVIRKNAKPLSGFCKACGQNERRWQPDCWDEHGTGHQLKKHRFSLWDSLKYYKYTHWILGFILQLLRMIYSHQALKQMHCRTAKCLLLLLAYLLSTWHSCLRVTQPENKTPALCSSKSLPWLKEFSIFRSKEGKSEQVVTGAQLPLRKKKKNKPGIGYQLERVRSIFSRLQQWGDMGAWDMQLLWSDPCTAPF